MGEVLPLHGGFGDRRYRCGAAGDARARLGTDHHIHLVGRCCPDPNLGISNALRLSLVGWSKTLAREVGRDGITSNIVLPGRIATGRIAFLDEQKAKREGRAVEEVAAESTASIPVGRYGEPSEYGDTVAFLASARASYLTGSVIRVDGGLIASI